MILIPLGTNGFFPSNNRHTSCYLLMPTPETAILLDAGTGMARLLQPEIRAKLTRVQELHVVLSHYHLDHTCGLFYLTGVWPGRKVTIHAPGHPLVQTDPHEALGRLLNPPLHPLSIGNLLLEISPVVDTRKEIAGLEFCFRPQKHPGGSAGIRIGNRIAYVTDTVADPETAEFAYKANLLLHEVWLNDHEAKSTIEPDGVLARAKHSWAGAVAEIAAKARVNFLAPVHHAPWRTTEEVTLLAQDIEKRSGVATWALEEGNEYDISPRETTTTLKDKAKP